MKQEKNFSIICRGIKTSFLIDKTNIILTTLRSIISPLRTYLNIYLMAKIVNGLLDKLSNIDLIQLVVFTIGVNWILSLIITIINYVIQYHSNIFYKNERMFLAKKIMSLDYEQIENKDVNYLYQKIQNDSMSGYNMYYLNQFFGWIISNISNIIYSLFLLMGLIRTLSFSLPTIVLFVTFILIVIFNLYSNAKINKQYFKLNNDLVPYNTMYNFYSNYFDDYHTGKDIRLYGMEKYLMKITKQQNFNVFKLQNNNEKKVLKYAIPFNILQNLFNVMIYCYVIYICSQELIQLGDIAQYVSSIGLLVSAIVSIFGNIQGLLNNNKYLVSYFKFLDLPTKETKINKLSFNDHIETIEFKNVSFKYPNSEVYSLKNFNFTFKKDVHYSIVGMNGAGKTTIVKLLSGLYTPTEGEILLNGINIEDINCEDYRKLFGIVFQDFKLFSFTLAQNIAHNQVYEIKKINDLIEKVGLSELVNREELKEEMYLYKNYDNSGIEVSGGEAQKIAIARALYNESSFVILDEPTAALDPVAEYEIYKKLTEITKGRTAIYISHRLSSCKLCDEILVIEKGELVQVGSHEKLVSDEGNKYFQLWQAQAQYYN